MLEDHRLLEQIKVMVGLGISARQRVSLDAHTIREQILAVAVKSMRKHLADGYELETGVAIAQREIDRILNDGGEPIQISNNTA